MDCTTFTDDEVRIYRAVFDAVRAGFEDASRDLAAAREAAVQQHAPGGARGVSCGEYVMPRESSAKPDGS